MKSVLLTFTAASVALLLSAAPTFAASSVTVTDPSGDVGFSYTKTKPAKVKPHYPLADSDLLKVRQSASSKAITVKVRIKKLHSSWSKKGSKSTEEFTLTNVYLSNGPLQAGVGISPVGWTSSSQSVTNWSFVNEKTVSPVAGSKVQGNKIKGSKASVAVNWSAGTLTITVPRAAIGKTKKLYWAVQDYTAYIHGKSSAECFDSVAGTGTLK